MSRLDSEEMVNVSSVLQVYVNRTSSFITYSVCSAPRNKMGVIVHLLCAAISMMSRVECSDLSFVIDMDKKNYYLKRELKFNLNMTELVDLENRKFLSDRKDVPFNQVGPLSLRI